MPSRADEPAAPSGLAAALRAATAGAHADLERRFASDIHTLADYTGFLVRHYAVFAALEPCFARFSGWRAVGIDLRAYRRLPQLRADLTALQVGIARMPAPAHPMPENFPAALGALYVLEGSSLGGQKILRDARARLGGRIDGATAFFGGGANRPSWPVFKSRLDAFGTANAAAAPMVAAGALAAFAAFASVSEQESPPKTLATHGV